MKNDESWLNICDYTTYQYTHYLIHCHIVNNVVSLSFRAIFRLVGDLDDLAAGTFICFAQNSNEFIFVVVVVS